MSNPMIELMEALEGARRANDPGADWLNLITVDTQGFPVARILTIRGVSEEGVVVTVNSDDPAYFGGYVNENYLAVAEALGLSRDALAAIARNSFEAAFLSDPAKAAFTAQLDEYLKLA